MVEVSTG